MSVITCIPVVPAYGRDYKTAKAAHADWRAGQDFQISCPIHPNDGAYISVRDGMMVEIHNLQGASLCVIAGDLAGGQ
jgi:hypothetical protein